MYSDPAAPPHPTRTGDQEFKNRAALLLYIRQKQTFTIYDMGKPLCHIKKSMTTNSTVNEKNKKIWIKRPLPLQH